ncbi:hypothetical protein OV208_32865 [Corallococcus sp. bb12-1]|uniref:hypothetical protein n=1 Tax=Corallococcus sp. bb12-1 TaxID=2996784 RepID=UPI0022711E0C|nr:hypothetical protein [Corallococcus sp. bb12-1]MCY1046150.1 hypothetical protein [Corallococcus sp. bb12-1]
MRHQKPFPGSGLLHPCVLGAVVLLLLNDHVFKARWPSWWTGKLSDVAGLAMFPLLLQALWEQLSRHRARDFHPSRAVVTGAVVLTGLCFSATKLSEGAGNAWRWALGGLQWPFRVLGAVLAGAPLPRIQPTLHTVDVTDLLTLPALLMALWLGWRRAAVAVPTEPPVDPRAESPQPR